MNQQDTTTVSSILDSYRKLPNPTRFTDPYFRDAMEVALSLALGRGAKIFVETGVTTNEGGASGCSTAVLADVAALAQGELYSCDIVPPHAIPPMILQKRFHYEQKPSEVFLAAFPGLVDFFYLDAGKRDGLAPLAEVAHVLRLSHAKTVLLIDDWDEEQRILDYHGKGHLSIPKYIDAGWRPIVSKYQMLLSR